MNALAVARAPGLEATHPVAIAEHRVRRGSIVEQFVQLMGKTHPIRTSHADTHLFRPRRRVRRGLDLSALRHVLAVDTVAGLAVVEGMATYDTLVAETLPRGFMPAVVPELRTITVGGAVAGIGIEATSFREGLAHDTVEECDVLTGNAQIVTCSPTRHPDLFLGFPNSYGTLGYALKLAIRLVPVRRLVRVEHVRYRVLADFLDAMEEAALGRGPLGRDGNAAAADFLDGVVFSRTEQYINRGTFVDEGPAPSDYTGMNVYYRSIRERPEDVLTTHDYIWRWDTDWFWCSRHFGMENPLVRRLCPRSLRGSRGYGILRRWAERLGLSPGRGQESVVQDIGFLPGASGAFLDWFLEDIGITPIWVCPFTPRRAVPLFPFEPGRLHFDIAFWDSVPRSSPPQRSIRASSRADRPGSANRRIEDRTQELHGLKSLYSRSYFDRETFDRLYGGEAWRQLKARYDPGGHLGSLFTKCVGA